MIHNSSNILEVINYYNFTHRHSFALTLNLMVNYGLRKKKGVENVLDWLWHFFSYVTVNKHIHVEQTLCFHKYQGLQPQVLWNVPLFKQNFFFLIFVCVEMHNWRSYRYSNTCTANLCAPAKYKHFFIYKSGIMVRLLFRLAICHNCLCLYLLQIKQAILLC